MSVGLDIDAADLERLQQRLLKASRVKFNSLLESLGAVIESQSRRRIQEEKKAPDGTPWKSWSEAYAASKHGPNKNHAPHPGQLRDSQGHSLLQLSGGLLDSLHSVVTFDEVEAGSNLIYAGVNNALRPFMGLSDDNTAEALEIVEKFLDREMSLEK